MGQLNILFMGCGFLASHIFPHVLVHARHVLYVDRERIEKVNYDNSIFPKNYIGKRKVTALTSLTQLLTSIRTTPIHISIKDVTHIKEICEKYNVDFIFVTFDNVESRELVKNYAVKASIPALFVGVTENHAYIDWAEHLVLPESEEKRNKVKEEISKIRDVCTRLEFRPLGAVAAAHAYHCFFRWITTGEKHMYQISVRKGINSTTFEVGK